MQWGASSSLGFQTWWRTSTSPPTWHRWAQSRIRFQRRRALPKLWQALLESLVMGMIRWQHLATGLHPKTGLWPALTMMAAQFPTLTKGLNWFPSPWKSSLRVARYLGRVLKYVFDLPSGFSISKINASTCTRNPISCHIELVQMWFQGCTAKLQWATQHCAWGKTPMMALGGWSTTLTTMKSYCARSSMASTLAHSRSLHQDTTDYNLKLFSYKFLWFIHSLLILEVHWWYLIQAISFKLQNGASLHNWNEPALSRNVPHLPGDAATTKDQIPWLITSDLDIVVLVSNDGNGFVQKKTMTISDVMCHITNVRGQTEATMLDHDLEPMTKDFCTLWGCNGLYHLARDVSRNQWHQ